MAAEIRSTITETVNMVITDTDPHTKRQACYEQERNLIEVNFIHSVHF